MKSDRWPKKVWNWDRATKTDAWSKEVAHIMTYLGLDPAEAMDLQSDLDEADLILMDKARQSWTLESHIKQKLRTFIQIHDYNNPGVLINANLSRVHRSLTTKFKAGVLPIKQETGRFKGVSREKRICDLCNKEVEDEIHFIFKCDTTEDARKKFIDPLSTKVKQGQKMSNIEVLKEMVSEEYTREFAKSLEGLYEHRKQLLYN